MRATTTAKGRVHAFKSAADDETHIVENTVITTLPEGFEVDVDLNKIAYGETGKKYVWITYKGKSGRVHSGYVRRRYVKAETAAQPGQKSADSDDELELEPRDAVGPRDLSQGPKTGFELEFNDIWVLPTTPRGDVSSELLKEAQRADKDLDKARMIRKLETKVQTDTNLKVTGNSKLKGVREKFWEEKNTEDETPFQKRTVLFRAPNRTWAATTDTSLRGLSNLEIVGAPLTPDELQEAETVADRRSLEALFDTVKRKRKKFLFTTDELAKDLKLVDVRRDVVLISNSNAQGLGGWHVQVTEAAQLKDRSSQKPGWWLGELNYSAWPILEQVVNVMKATRYKGTNPKNLFGADPLDIAAHEKDPEDEKRSLPRTSVATLLGKAPEADAAAQTKWVVETAKTLGVGLDDTVGKHLVGYSKGLLQPTRFTWRQFFTGLLYGNDLIAEWSRRAFGGTEDFGYGMIKDKTLDRDWYVHEFRALRNFTDVSQIWTRQEEWATDPTVAASVKRAASK